MPAFSPTPPIRCLVLLLAHLPSADGCSATVFGDIFSGWAVTFTDGTFPYEDFLAAGAEDNEVSSIRVEGNGCVAILYGDSLTGWAASFPEGAYGYDELYERGAVDNSASSIFVGWQEDNAASSLDSLASLDSIASAESLDCVDTPAWYNKFGSLCSDYLAGAPLAAAMPF